MSHVQRLHEERKQRLARFEVAAQNPKPAPKPKPVVIEFRAPVPRKPDVFNPEDERSWMIEIEGMIPSDDTKFPKIEDIVRAVCAHTGIAKHELTSARRNGPVAAARHLAYYLCRRLTEKSLPEIGRRIGNRDHTTILHGVRRTEHRMLTDERLNASIEMLMETIGK